MLPLMIALISCVSEFSGEQRRTSGHDNARRREDHQLFRRRVSIYPACLGDVT